MLRWLIGLSLIALASLFFWAFGRSELPAPSPAAAKTPNIIFILADDLDVDLFNQDKKLPSLLVKKGTSFINHFAPLSLCCPSRVSTLRGQFPHNTTIYSNLGETGGGFLGTFTKGLESSTIATWLQDAGYRTALLGKYLNGYPVGAPRENYIPPGWTYWLVPNGGDFQSQYNYSVNENGKTINYGNSPKDYFGDVLTNKTIAFINDCVANHPQQPFFIFVSSLAPHKPATVPPRYEHLYKDYLAPRTPSFDEKDVSDKPSWVKSKKPLFERQIHDIDDFYRHRKASLLGLSDLVEKVIATLERKDLLDTTYIFFSSDNGFHQGQHRLNSGKTTAYEEDIKLPLVVRGPHVAEGKIVDVITANVDYAPTFADIANIAIPNFVDGRSFLPYINGFRTESWRAVMLLESGGAQSINRGSKNPLFEVQDPFDIDLLDNAKYTIPAFTGLRLAKNPFNDNGPLTYIAYDTDEKELYFLDRDPYQLENSWVVADETLKTKLDAWTKLLRAAKGQALRDIEQTPP